MELYKIDMKALLNQFPTKNVLPKSTSKKKSRCALRQKRDHNQELLEIYNSSCFYATAGTDLKDLFLNQYAPASKTVQQNPTKILIFQCCL